MGCTLDDVAGGELIREARLRAGLTQTELSELTGRERSVIARWEQGVISPPIDSLMRDHPRLRLRPPLHAAPDRQERRPGAPRGAAGAAERAGRVAARRARAEACPGGTLRGESWPPRARAVFDPYELLGALQGHSVSFVVIGAFARVVHGTRELTDGIDISPSMREENLSRLEAALEDLDASRADGQPLDLRNLAGAGGRAGDPRRRAQARPRAGGHARLRRPPPPRRPREPLGRGLRPQVASADDLARMLGALDREHDAERLLRLRRLMNLERSLGHELGRSHGIEI